MAGHMGARNRTQQNLEVVRTDPARGLIFIKGSVPGHKGSWLTIQDAIKVARREEAPYPAGLFEEKKVQAAEEEQAPAGLVEEGAVHEMPALPSDEEVAAIAAEQEAGAAAEAEAEAAAEGGQSDAGGDGEGEAPAADESKEG
jgi:large subunit ribosomal protein L3